MKKISDFLMDCVATIECGIKGNKEEYIKAANRLAIFISMEHLKQTIKEDIEELRCTLRKK